MKKCRFTALIPLVLLLLLTGCSGNRQETQSTEPADPSINEENAQHWRELMQTYRKEEEVGQLMLVRYTGGCSAHVFYYIKNRESNDAWELVFEEDDAVVGKYGIGKTSEGDALTPVGNYKAVTAFGILPDPGTAFDWIDVTPTTFACDEDCEYYNQIIDTEETGHECTGEEMYLYSPEYNYGLALDYNPENTYPDGSAVFLHCKGAKAFTGGCVAITQDHMELVLKTASPGFTICIGED